MSIKLSDSIRVGQQKPLEDKYFNELVPYTSTSQVNTLLPKAVRHIGLTVNINKEEYWYKDGIEDANLVLKVSNTDALILKNQEQDGRLENLEGENASQNDLINDLFSELQSEKTRNDIQDTRIGILEGIHYVWSPTNRTLTLFDRGGNQLSQVSLVSLDNEGTDIRYNSSTLSLELYNADNELLDSIPVSSFIGSVGTQLQLNSNELQLKDSQGNVLSTVNFAISNIDGLQSALDSKEDKSNKQNSLTADGTGTKYPTVDAVNTGLSNKISGSGLVNKIPKYTDEKVLGFSNIIDDGTSVNINTVPSPLSSKLIFKTSLSGSFIESYNAVLDTWADIIMNKSGGNLGVGKSPSEKLDVNGNVKANGFKTPNGAANKVLTSDGDTFDLNTKADLVDGKVPATQLPSYVDDVLEYANLASFPATGENGKIYIAIDTNLTYRWGGSSYVVMSSSLALGETSSTAYRGDRGKIAYDHSQTSGNVHNTKVEELSDIGSETTTIADTDVILKKETGGFWKKITFANFKNWFTTELAKKINIGLDTVFNFKNISAMTLTKFRSITPDVETIYFIEEQNSTGWQQVRYNSNLSIGYQALTESVITINNETFLELNSDSTFNLIDVATTKINGIFEKDFMIITFSSKVDTPSTPNQWFKLILRVNGVQVAVSPVFYLLEPAGMPERISHSFALNVTPEMITHGITLHIKPSVMLILNSHSLTVTRVHKSTNANF